MTHVYERACPASPSEPVQVRPTFAVDNNYSRIPSLHSWYASTAMNHLPSTQTSRSHLYLLRVGVRICFKRSSQARNASLVDATRILAGVFIGAAYAASDVRLKRYEQAAVAPRLPCSPRCKMGTPRENHAVHASQIECVRCAVSMRMRLVIVHVMSVVGTVVAGPPGCQY